MAGHHRLREALGDDQGGRAPVAQHLLSGRGRIVHAEEINQPADLAGGQHFLDEEPGDLATVLIHDYNRDPLDLGRPAPERSEHQSEDEDERQRHEKQNHRRSPVPGPDAEVFERDDECLVSHGAPCR